MELARQSVEMDRLLGRDDTIWTESSEMSVAQSLIALGEPLRAVNELHTILGESPAPDSDCHSALIFEGMPLIGRAFTDLGRHDASLELLTATLARCRQELGDDDGDLVRLYLSTAWALAAHGSGKDALAHLTAVEPICDRGVSAQAECEVNVALGRGTAHRASGSQAEALHSHNLALELATATYGTDHPAWAAVALELVRTRLAIDPLQDVSVLLDQAHETIVSRFGDNSPLLSQVRTLRETQLP